MGLDSATTTNNTGNKSLDSATTTRITSKKRKQRTKATKNQMLGFETLTLVPIDKRLINPKILTKEEKNWINS